MSACCQQFPNCDHERLPVECPKEWFENNNPELAKKLIEALSEPYPITPKGKIWKSDGKGVEHLVDDLDYFNDEGQKIKRRNRQPTNITPKKKKRK